MKKLLVAAFALFCAVAANAQVKNYVGIVRQKYYPAQEEFLKDLSDSLKRNGYSSYSEYVNDYLKGGFGSGFIYVDKDGTNYVVTNRHVVSQAASASIEFENEDGSTKKYENLSVVITDDDIDLAILRFEGNAKPFKNGLSISSAKLSDGQNVVSAGFPGLGNDPVWQFGKGSVTNASARIKDLIDPSISTVIQHSAQVDAGNSGGPLLIESKSAVAGYEVVGINTWKAVGRDSTNFSIPAKLALQLIEKSKKASDDGAEKAKRAEKFKQALNDKANDYTSIVKFVSYDLAASDGEEYFNDIMRHGSTKVRNRVAGEFAYNPIEGLRYAVAYNLFENFSGENATEENLSKVEWKKEHGLFRISSTGDEKNTKASKSKNNKKSSSKEKKDSKNKVGLPEVSWNGIQKPYTIGISAGGLFPLQDSNDTIDFDPRFDLLVSGFFGDRGMFGPFFEYQHGKFSCGPASESMNIFSGGLTFQVPLDFNFFVISPKVMAGAGFSAGSEVSSASVFAEFGAEAVFNFGIDYIRPGLDLGYRIEGMTFKNNNSIASDSSTEHLFVLRLTLGILF